MLREISKEEVKKRIFDENVFVLILSESPSKTSKAKYSFVPIAEYGTPKKILEVLESHNCRFMEDTDEDKQL